MNNNTKERFSWSNDYISWLRGMNRFSKLNPEERNVITKPIKALKIDKTDTNNIITEIKKKVEKKDVVIQQNNNSIEPI